MARDKRPNLLFRVLLIISVGIHVFLFMHISGIYKSRALSVIELTLEDMSRPEARNIPRPRPRPKRKTEPLNFSRPRVDMRQIPAMRPMKVDPVESDLPDNLMERIDIASIPQAPGAMVMADWRDFSVQDTSDDFDTAGAYFDMVRFQIEQHKHYPSQAKDARMEGRVTIRFVITQEGKVRSVFVSKSSHKRLLDEAALEAVRGAAPFPIPPQRLFDGDISLELDIVFEIT